MAKKPKADKPRLSVVPDDGGLPKDAPNKPEDSHAEEERRDAAEERAEELVHRTKLAEKFSDVMKDVAKGFQAQWERGDDQLDYWDIYDQIIGGKQSYAGNSQIYLPIVKMAVNARVTRFTNQIFPRSGRNVDCISSDEKPYDIMALLEHYIRKTKLRTQIVPAIVRNGDVEGQYNLYVSWENSARHVVIRKKPTIEIEGESIEDPEGEEEDVEEIETLHMRPTVEVLADADVLILPHTANSVGEALAKGGSVTVIRRWSKSRVQTAIDDEEIDAELGEILLEEMGTTKDDAGVPEPNRKHVSAAGITMGTGGKEVTLYETWTRLKIDDERRLCRGYYAGTKASDGGGGETDRILSIKRCPYWNDKCPVLSAPVKKIAGVFKGQSEVKAAADLQYAANDTINEAMDSAAYALMPIVMTDPSKNPRVGSMILNLAAIWETNPNDTKFAQFPALWKDGLTIVAGLKQEIFQILSISPAIMPQSTGTKGRRNQAEIAMEQQVDILSTADVCTNLEDEILTPLLRWFVELDYQYRDEEITVKQYGQMGVRAAMQVVPPLQNERRFEFRWFGVESARNAQQMQMQTAAINTVKGVPPQMYMGYELNLVPVIQLWLENAFGSRVTPEIFKDLKSKLALDPKTENQFLEEGLALPVHELDEDQEHMQVHIQAMKNGDPTGAVREHLLRHRMQMDKKMQMQQASIATMQRGAPGSPGGAGPGAAGTPRPGAVPAQPRGGQQPPGAIHSDQLQDPAAAPRR